MKLYKLLICGLMLLGFVVSCKPEPKVLEFDDAINPKKPTEGVKDKMPPIDVLNLYAFFTDKQVDFVIKKEVADNTVTIANNLSLAVTVKTNRPPKEDVALSVHTMTAENAKEQYDKVVRGEIKELPPQAYNINGNIVLTPQKQEETINITFNVEELKALNIKDKFIIPLIIESNKDNTESVIIYNYCVINISLVEVESLVAGDNVGLVGNMVNGTVVSGNDLRVSSNYAQGHLYKLNNGDKTRENWWIQISDKSIYLDIKLANTALRTIKGININTSTSNQKKLTGFNVEVSNDNGASWVSQGVIRNNNSSAIYVEFKKPIKINAIRLKDFYGNSSYADVYEVELVAQ